MRQRASATSTANAAAITTAKRLGFELDRLMDPHGTSATTTGVKLPRQPGRTPQAGR